MATTLDEQMSAIRNRITDSPFKDYREEQFAEPVPLPEDKTDLTGQDVQAAFPQLYTKPVTTKGEGLGMQPAFEPFAEQQTFLGIPIGKRTTPEVEMEPLMQFEMFDALGVGFTTEKRYTPFLDYDPKLVTPDLSLRDIVDYENNPDAQKALMSYTFLHDKSGRAYKVDKDRFETYDDLIDYADQIGAVAYTRPDGKKKKFPWSTALSKQMKMPDIAESKFGTSPEIRRAMAANSVLSYNLIDSDLSGPMYARYLNEVLIERGVTDERTRAILINSQLTAPAMGDLRNLVGNVSDNLARPFFEMGLWGFGEMADLMDTAIKFVGVHNNLMETDDPRPLAALGFPVDYERREEIMMKLYDDFPSMLQRYYIQKGANISLDEARIMASRYTGLLPRGVQMFAEIRGGSKIANIAKEFKSASEYKAFKKWSENLLEAKQKTDDGADTTFETLLDRWKENTSKWYRSKDAINRRLATYFQVEDARFMPADYRTEVVEATSALEIAIDRRESLLANVKKKGGVMSDQTKLRLGAIEENINLQTNRLTHLRVKSSVPKFIRDSNIQDWYLITGSATFGHYAPEAYDVDPELGELIGLVTGMAVSMSQGSAKRFLSFTSALKGDPRKKLNYLVENLMQGGSATFQQGLLGKAGVMAKYEDQMIAMGVDPDIVALSVADILDLSALKYFEQLTKDANVKVAKLTDSATQEMLQNNLNRQKELTAALRERLMNTQNLDPNSDFYKMIATTLGVFEKEAKRFESEIKLLKANDVKYFNNLAKQREGSFPAAKPDKDFEKTWNDFVEMKLLDEAQNPGQFAVTAKSLRVEQATVTTAAAQRLGQALVTRAQAADVLGKARDKPLEVTTTNLDTGTAIDMQFEPADMESTGHLLAFQLLSRHGVEKSKASAPFVAMDNAANSAIYLDVDGKTLSGTPQVDMSDVFFALLEESADLPGLDKITKKGYKASDSINLRGVMNELTDPYFNSVAASQKISKSKVLSNLRETIQETSDYVFKHASGDALQAEVSEWLVRNKGAGLMTMNMSQLLRFDRSLSSMAYNAAGEAVKGRLKLVQRSVSDKFDQMVIMDNGEARPVGRMEITYDGQQVPVTELLQRAKAGWTRYKNVWYDTNEQGKLVPKLMAWNRQQSGEITSASPFGVDFAVNPREWIKVDSLLKMSDNELDTYLESFAEALGTRKVTSRGRGREPITTYSFTSNDPEAQAFSTIFQAAIAEHIVEAAKNGTLDANMMTGLRNIENKFVFTNSKGKKTKMFTISDVVDDYVGFGSLSDDLKAEKMAEANVKIKRATEAALIPAEEHKAVIDSSISYLQKLLPANAPGGATGINDIGAYIASGGQEGFKRMVAAIAKDNPQYDEKQIKSILREAYVRDMVLSSFIETPQTMMKADGKTGSVTVHDTDSLARYLGIGDPAQEKFLKEFLDFDTAETGISHYDNARAVVGFLSELKDDPLAKKVNIRGIPRAMSVESYISRFYAINRGVVRPQYVGTEAVLQQIRFGKFSFIKSVISDPELGVLFLEMVRTGRPLDPKRNTRFETLLIQAMGKDNALYGGEQPEVVVDNDGNRIEVYGSKGYYKDQKLGSGFRRGFPEMRRSRQELEEAGVTTGMFSAIQ